MLGEMTLNRRTGSGSDLAGSLHSTSSYSMAWSIPLFIGPSVVCGGGLRIGQVATASCSAVERHLPG